MDVPTQQPENDRATVLMPINHYLPGYKAGGPIRKLASLVEGLGGEYTFKVVTKDRDFKDRTAYPGVAIDTWSHVGKAEIGYLSPDSLSFWRLRRLLRDTDYDLMYLNSFFEPHFAIKPLLLRRLGLIPPRPVIVAPNGEFSVGALKLKGLKKRLYMLIARLLRLYRGVLWQAASEYEVADIRR
ncbi:MAG: glycosyl transferase family 1, partial [Dehalococcoidia bacterium]|nr:glycosyl transferase family 1 [Dehalococcoidia bacterium]